MAKFNLVPYFLGINFGDYKTIFIEFWDLGFLTSFQNSKLFCLNSGGCCYTNLPH